MIVKTMGVLALSGTLMATALADDGIPALLQGKISKEIQKKFPQAKIELLPVSSRSLPEVTEVVSVKYISESPQGIAEMAFICSSDGTITEKRAKIPFRASLRVAQATQRIRFGQVIQSDDYTMQEVDVTSGFYREILGLLITRESLLNRVQAHQTLIENQPILSSALIPVPDVVRGDVVNLRLYSSGVLIQTQGVAQESANIGSHIKVLSLKTKRELSGVLSEGSTVEVQL